MFDEQYFNSAKQDGVLLENSVYQMALFHFSFQ